MSLDLDLSDGSSRLDSVLCKLWEECHRWYCLLGASGGIHCHFIPLLVILTLITWLRWHLSGFFITVTVTLSPFIICRMRVWNYVTILLLTKLWPNSFIIHWWSWLNYYWEECKTFSRNISSDPFILGTSWFSYHIHRAIFISWLLEICFKKYRGVERNMALNSRSSGRNLIRGSYLYLFLSNRV